MTTGASKRGVIERQGKTGSAPYQFAALPGPLRPGLCGPPRDGGRRDGKGTFAQAPFEWAADRACPVWRVPAAFPPWLRSAYADSPAVMASAEIARTLRHGSLFGDFPGSVRDGRVPTASADFSASVSMAGVAVLRAAISDVYGTPSCPATGPLPVAGLSAAGGIGGGAGLYWDGLGSTGLIAAASGLPSAGLAENAASSRSRRLRASAAEYGCTGARCCGTWPAGRRSPWPERTRPRPVAGFAVALSKISRHEPDMYASLQAGIIASTCARVRMLPEDLGQTRKF